MVLLVDTSKAVPEQQQLTGNGESRRSSRGEGGDQSLRGVVKAEAG